MIGIKNLRLHNVRSHGSGSFQFDPNMNAIVGPNGSGKTTIIESLYLLLRGSSFKGSIGEIAQYGTDQFQAHIELETPSEATHMRRLSFQQVETASTKKWTLDSKNYARLPAANRLPVVLFEPDLARLVTGSPQRRRDYLDHIAAQLDFEMSTLQNRFERTLRQRNQLLKSIRESGRSPGDSLFVWNTQLAQLSETVVRARCEVISKLQQEISSYYRELGGSDDILLTYQSSVSVDPKSYANRLLQFLETSVARDIALGHTAFGPHRDELEIRLADQPAEERASRGETRTLVIALKLLETKLLSDHFEKQSITPTLLLDDVLSELDLVHQERVLEGFKGHQVFITTTDAHALTPGVHTIAL